MAFICTTAARVSQAYNLSPISFENLYRIAADGDLQGLKDVQRRGLNLDSPNMDGDTAVCVAIKRQDYLAYKTLIRAGAKSNPDCVERLPEYAHKNFLANYNQKYAAPQTPTNWAKSGTAFVVGVGIAAGIVALASSGGGGGSSKSGSSHADDASNTANCDLNPCAEGCYENITCAAGYQCTQYESKCNLGCTKCEQKPECVNVPECTKGCYTNLTCQSGYKCSKYNKCNGCEKCEKAPEETPDSSNSRYCKDFNSAKNYCNACNDGYTAVNGVCRLNAPEHCADYSFASEKCSACEAGYKLESDKRTCTVDNGDSGDSGSSTACTAANYPLTAKPANATSESCTDGSTTRYKITSCNQGYNLSADGKSCIESSESETCDLQLYPLISEPENAATDKCEDKSGTHYRILSCTNGTTLSTDKLSCVTNCDRTVYNLTECNNGKVCDTCTDSTGTYYKFNKCMSGFVQDGIQDTCIKEEVKTSDNDVVNNDNITVDDNGQIVQSSSPFSRDWLLGFTNYTPTGETVSSNLYNARDKEASITIKDTKTAGSRPSIIGLASIYLRTPIVINSYNNYKGEITISSVNQVAVYGIMTTGGAYNSYNGNGIIKLTRNTSSPNEDFSSGLTGMGVWLEGVDSISGIAERQIADESSFLYNAFGGTGLIHLESNKGNVRGMAGYNVINAANGGTGTIEIVANDGSVDGLTNVDIGTESYFTANAYGRNSTGNITITAKNNKRPVYGIGGMLGRPIYNAYGQDATGNITINGSGIGIMNGNNAANGGAGNITINSDDTSSAGQIIGMENNSSGLLYNALGAGSYGNITITVAGQSTDTVFGLKGMIDNGSIDGGVGRIIITDTGNNNIIGMNGGGNFANSSVTINSNGDTSKTVIGMSNVRLKSETQDEDYADPAATDAANQNYGTIDVTTTNGAATYGIYAKNTNVLNDKNGKITINSAGVAAHGIYSNKSIYNNGSITVNQSYFKDSYIQSGIYLEENENSNGVETVYNKGNISLRMPSNVTVLDYNIPFSASGYGIYSTGNVQNSGNIDIANGTLASSAYGIFSKIPNQSTNTGRITVKGGANYGLINVNNGVGGYINLAPTYFKDNNGLDEARGTGMVSYRPNSYSNDITINLVNGSASTPATSVNDTTKGYITVVGNGANKSPTIFGPYFRPTLIGISGEDNTNIYNYGVISMQGSSIAGIYNGASGKIYNYGYININANYSTAAGILSESDDVEIYNEKEIIITASTTFANRYWYGIAGGNITNNGNLTMNIMNGYSAIAMTSGINNGNITVSLADKTNADGIRGAGINNGNIKINGGLNVNGMFVSQDLTSGEIKDIKAINNKSGNIMLDNISNGNGIAAANKTTAYNEGNITISNSTATAALYGISLEREAKAINSGNITISNISGKNVYGIYGINKKNDEYLDGSGVILNSGNIEISDATGDNVYGIYADQYKIKNTGNITLSNVDESSSYGIYAINGSKVYNSGTITINGESYNKNEADGKFIYIDSSSSMINESEITASSAFDTVALGGGKFVLGKDGKIIAPEIKGDITADAGITSGGFDKTYSNKNAFSGKTDEVKLNSGSALFDAALKNNDIVMTMKDFDEVVDDKSLAAYLQRNYEAKRNEQLFNSLKLTPTTSALSDVLNKKLGFSLLPNFAQENMNVFRSLSNLVTDTMFSQDLTNERMMVGYDYLGQDRSSKGRVTGYENTANSSYFLADTKLNNRQRFGLGVALTRFNSDYDDDSTRKATFAQALGSYMHDFGNRWKYAGLLRVGYADGDYKRQSDNERVSGDTSDILYGFNNELRYNYDLGFMTLEPQVELNAYGYYQRKIKEDDAKTNALQIKGTNNLSLESGAGLYLSKEAVYGENGRLKGRLGGSYYRELSQPYHTMRARVRDTDGYYLIESTDIFDRNRMVVRADIAFSWKAIEFYFRGSQFMEDKHTTVINAGIKYNF